MYYETCSKCKVLVLEDELSEEGRCSVCQQDHCNRCDDLLYSDEEYEERLCKYCLEQKEYSDLYSNYYFE